MLTVLLRQVLNKVGFQKVPSARQRWTEYYLCHASVSAQVPAVLPNTGFAPSATLFPKVSSMDL